MIPRYAHIEIPLLAELLRRGGRARPSDADEAEREKHRYFIYRVSRVSTEAPEIEIIQDPSARIREGKLHLRPTAYTVTIGENPA